MSFTPNKFLKEDSNIYLRDQQHAARLFVDDQFRLAPKHKFLYHVAFNINQNACKDAALINRHRNEIGMLVKSIDLPKFEISADLVNQYNRKKAVQYQHTPGEINLIFHDDNMGLINKVWQNYYSYYYADSNSAQSPGAYNRNATRNSNFITAPYGLDNGSTSPFFNYITVYQMARHEFVSYKLINPIIKKWDHNKLAYSENTLHDFSMSLLFESIAYGSGKVTSDEVNGFALEHYDSTPSPLTGDPNITSVSPTFTNTLNNPDANVNTIIQQINTYQNTNGLNIFGTTGIINNLATAADTKPAINGIQGIAFPINETANAPTVATQVKLG
jgi:hypothetical protein